MKNEENSKWNGLRILRDWKTHLTGLIFSLFWLVLLTLSPTELTFPAIEMSEEYEDERQIYRLIPKVILIVNLGEKFKMRWEVIP